MELKIVEIIEDNTTTAKIKGRDYITRILSDGNNSLEKLSVKKIVFNKNGIDLEIELRIPEGWIVFSAKCDCDILDQLSEKIKSAINDN